MFVDVFHVYTYLCTYIYAFMHLYIYEFLRVELQIMELIKTYVEKFSKHVFFTS